MELVAHGRISSVVAIAAVGECINYLFDAGNTRSRLAKLFRRIHESLIPGGLFLL